MNQDTISASAIAKASVQRKLLDTQLARQHPSVSSFAQELVLAEPVSGQIHCRIQE
jgi:hypothetical protein